jgi:hypothetical protein
MAVSYVNQAQAGSATVTLPTGIQAGDYIIIFAFRNTTTAPSLPAGFTNITNGSANVCAYRIFFKIATGSESGTTVTATNANAMQAVVYRGVASIGGNASTTNAAATSVTVPAIAESKFTTPSASDWVVGFAGSKQTTSAGVPTGTTQRGTMAAGTTAGLVAFDTNAGVASWAATTAAAGASATGASAVVELVPASNADMRQIKKNTAGGITTFDKAAVVGNVIVVIQSIFGTTAPAAPTDGSNTYTLMATGNDTNGTNIVNIYAAPVTTAVSTVTGGTGAELTVLEITGVATTFTGSTSGVNGIGTQPTTSLAVSSGSLVIAGEFDEGTAAITPNTGFYLETSETNNSSSERLAVVTKLAASSGSLSPGASAGYSGSWALAAVEFKAPSAGPTNWTKSLSDTITLSDSPTNTLTHAKAATFQDNFNTGTTYDSVKWPATYNGSGIALSGGQALFTPAAGASLYVGMASMSQDLDFVGSSAYIQLVDVGAAATIPSIEIYMLQAYIDSNNRLFWYLDASLTLSCYQVVAGTQTRLEAGTAYNSATMKYFRIREAAGTTYFEYAADPTSTWTVFHSMANVITMSALTIEVTVGHYGTETSTATVKFDNFNTLPSTAFSQSPTDTLTLSESIVKKLNKTNADTLTSTDSAIRKPVKNQADTLTSADAMAKNNQLNKSDAVTSNDALTKNPVKILIDSLAGSDAISKKPSLQRADTITTSDSMTYFKLLLVNLADTLTSSDAIIKAIGRKPSDNITLSDVSLRNYVKKLADTIVTSDGMPHTATFHLQINDTITGTETMQRRVAKFLADTVLMTDGPATTNHWTRTFSDNITAADTFRKTMTLQRSDALALAEIVVKAFIQKRSDTVILDDATSMRLKKILADIATANDDFAFALSVRQDLSVPISLTTKDGMIELRSAAATAAPEARNSVVTFENQNTSVIML